MLNEVTSTKVDISVNFAGLRLKNPVFTASGTCGYGNELADFMNVNALGGFITKSITLKPRKGNRTPDEARMELMYLPYVPSLHEDMILRGRRILADQMEFLLASVPRSSRLHA